MINEAIIINLQALAAILMGYEYFISIRLRDYLDNEIRIKLNNAHNNYRNEVRKQIDILWRNVGYIPTTLFFAGAAAATYYSLKLLVTPSFNIWVLIFAMLFILFFGCCALLGIGKLLEFILPLAVPSFLRSVIAFLLYCPKGIIAGIGMLFLVASFICRYINLLSA